jgi:hypothetical protein
MVVVGLRHEFSEHSFQHSIIPLVLYSEWSFGVAFFNFDVVKFIGAFDFR